MSSDQQATPDTDGVALGKKARTRKMLLNTAGELYARKGVDETTVEDIAEAAGVSVGSVYAHFGSKEALALTFAEAPMELLEQVLVEARRNEPSPFRRVIKGGEAFMRFTFDQPAACRWAMIRSMAPHHQHDDAPLSETGRALAGRLQQGLMEVAADVKAAMDAGEIDQAPIDETLVFLWGTWHGVTLMVYRQDGMAIPPELAERALAFASKTINRGLGYSPPDAA